MAIDNFNQDVGAQRYFWRSRQTSGCAGHRHDLWGIRIKSRKKNESCQMFESKGRLSSAGIYKPYVPQRSGHRRSPKSHRARLCLALCSPLLYLAPEGLDQQRKYGPWMANRMVQRAIGVLGALRAPRTPMALRTIRFAIRGPYFLGSLLCPHR